MASGSTRRGTQVDTEAQERPRLLCTLRVSSHTAGADEICQRGGVSRTEGRPDLLLTSRLPATALIVAGKEHCCSPRCEQP